MAQRSIKIGRILLCVKFGPNFDLKNLYFWITLHDYLKDIHIFTKKPPGTSKVLEKWFYIFSRHIWVVFVPLPLISSLKRSEFAKCLSTNRVDLKIFEKIYHFELWKSCIFSSGSLIQTRAFSDSLFSYLSEKSSKHVQCSSLQTPHPI